MNNMTSSPKRFDILERLGEGSFAVVVLAYDHRRMCKVAIKCVKDKFDTLEEALMNPEVQIFRCLPRHPNIVNLLEVLYCPKTKKLSLVFEYVHLSLYDFIICHINRASLGERELKFIFFQIAKGIGHMHAQGVFHRDIKPENILINKDTLQVKVADFGCCKGIYDDDDLTEYISTRWYRPPECGILYGFYGKSMDIWAMACVFFEIVTTEPMFPGGDELDQVAVINSVIGSPSDELFDFFSRFDINEGINFIRQRGIGLRRHFVNFYHGRYNLFEAQFVDLLGQMLQYDPRQRYSASGVLRHKFFDCFEAKIEYQDFGLKDRQTQVMEVIDKMLRIKQKNLSALGKLKILEVSLAVKKKNKIVNQTNLPGITSIKVNSKRKKAFRFENSVYLDQSIPPISHNFKNHKMSMSFTTSAKNNISNLNAQSPSNLQGLLSTKKESKPDSNQKIKKGRKSLFLSPYTLKSQLFSGKLTSAAMHKSAIAPKHLTPNTNPARNSMFASNLFKTNILSARTPKITINPEDAILRSVCQTKTFNQKLKLKKQIQALTPHLKQIRELDVDSQFLQKIIRQKRRVLKLKQADKSAAKTKIKRKRKVNRSKCFASIKRTHHNNELCYGGILNIRSCQAAQEPAQHNAHKIIPQQLKVQQELRKEEAKALKISEFNVGSHFSLVQNNGSKLQISQSLVKINDQESVLFKTLHSVNITSRSDLRLFDEETLGKMEYSNRLSGIFDSTLMSRSNQAKDPALESNNMSKQEDFSFSEFEGRQNFVSGKSTSDGLLDNPHDNAENPKDSQQKNGQNVFKKTDKYSSYFVSQNSVQTSSKNKKRALQPIQVFGKNNNSLSTNKKNNLISRDLKISQKDKNSFRKSKQKKNSFDSSVYSQKKKMSSIFMNVIKL